jgi:menaquinone-dependent protoporphyrinogen oxidase
MGRWHAASFLKQHRSELTRIPTAVFALGPISPTGDDRAGSERQLQRALGKVRGVEPVSVAVFGGVVDPTKLRFPFNHMPAGDARDWNAIRAWSERLATALEPSSDQPLANGS